MFILLENQVYAYANFLCTPFQIIPVRTFLRDFVLNIQVYSIKIKNIFDTMNCYYNLSFNHSILNCDLFSVSVFDILITNWVLKSLECLLNQYELHETDRFNWF